MPPHTHLPWPQHAHTPRTHALTRPHRNTARTHRTGPPTPGAPIDPQPCAPNHEPVLSSLPPHAWSPPAAARGSPSSSSAACLTSPAPGRCAPSTSSPTPLRPPLVLAGLATAGALCRRRAFTVLWAATLRASSRHSRRRRRRLLPAPMRLSSTPSSALDLEFSAAVPELVDPAPIGALQYGRPPAIPSSSRASANSICSYSASSARHHELVVDGVVWCHQKNIVENSNNDNLPLPRPNSIPSNFKIFDSEPNCLLLHRIRR